MKNSSHLPASIRELYWKMWNLLLFKAEGPMSVLTRRKIKINLRLIAAQVVLISLPDICFRSVEEEEVTQIDSVGLWRTPELIIMFQFSSVAQSCLTLCDPMNRSMPGLPVNHQLPEFTQTHVHQVGDALQPSHPLSSSSPPAPNPS